MIKVMIGMFLLLLVGFACTTQEQPKNTFPLFVVVCRSQGDTLFFSDSVSTYRSPGYNHQWLFTLDIDGWIRDGWNSTWSPQGGFVVEVSGDCVVRRRLNPNTEVK